jgi:hypothetical protein
MIKTLVLVSMGLGLAQFGVADSLNLPFDVYGSQHHSRPATSDVDTMQLHSSSSVPRNSNRRFPI